MAQMVKNLPAKQEIQIWSLGQEDPLEKGVATHSSIFPWRIPWREEPGRLQSMELQRVGHDWATKYACMLYLESETKWGGWPSPATQQGVRSGLEFESLGLKFSALLTVAQRLPSGVSKATAFLSFCFIHVSSSLSELEAGLTRLMSSTRFCHDFWDLG